jgi:hypothetical protein
MILAFASLLCVILAAHFLRMGAMAGVVVCLALPAVAVLTWARWALRALQALLILGSVSWVVTALRIGAERRVAGEPWLRMALILGTVAALSALAAGLLSRRSVLERFPAAPEKP